jgi:hypothetical protein
LSASDESGIYYNIPDIGSIRKWAEWASNYPPGEKTIDNPFLIGGIPKLNQGVTVNETYFLTSTGGNGGVDNFIRRINVLERQPILVPIFVAIYSECILPGVDPQGLLNQARIETHNPKSLTFVVNCTHIIPYYLETLEKLQLRNPDFCSIGYRDNPQCISNNVALAGWWCILRFTKADKPYKVVFGGENDNIHPNSGPKIFITLVTYEINVI